jgi:hypothetical protein
MTVLGLASLGGLASVAFATPVSQQFGQALRLQMWTFLSGWSMYMMTSGYVFDRFIMAWAVLMPIVWVNALPRLLMVVQAIGLAAAMAHQVNVYLM